jgi:lipid II:glycine glycyltransferase (peptidoglycan interpeptide bridge formation enzyme)
VLQSWAWGEFKSRWGWSAERWLLTGESGSPDAHQDGHPDGRPQAMVQLLRRAAGRMPYCVLYTPKGPVAGSTASFAEALTWIERRAHATRAIWAKLDGDCHLSIMQPGEDPKASLQSLRAVLHEHGWRTSPNQVQFRNTAFSDLRHTDDELLAGMKQKWRYNIRLAEKRGVRIRQAAPDDAPMLYRMYAETGKRDGFLIREPDYYYDAWRTMGAVGLLAEHESSPTPLAGLLLFRFTERAWYFYGMSRAEGREHMPNYLLQWAAMRWARDHGCTVYDWWGAPEALDEHDSMWGVYRFKEGFGAQFVEGLGAWDYAPSPALYRAYTRWMPSLWRLARRAKGTDLGTSSTSVT